MAVGRILRDFSGWTSAHGIPHIGSAQNMCLRVFWTIIFMASSGMFIYQMILLIKKYKSYDVTVQTELKFEERYFPAVTVLHQSASLHIISRRYVAKCMGCKVCNLNPYKETKMNEVPEMQSLIGNYTDAIAGRAVQADPLNSWGFNTLNDTIAIQSRARDHMMFIASEYKSNNDITTITYAKEEFIQNCAYNTKPCNVEKDFSPRVDPIYGACFTFNDAPEDGEPKYKSTRAGPLYGLRLLLKSNQTEYLPLTESAGVRVAVHKQGEEPFPDAFGYNAAAGFTTSFGIKFIQTERMKAPHGNCTDDDGHGPFYYDSKYSVEGCFRSCFQKNIIDNCKCADPRYAVPNSQKNYCTTADIDCVADYSSNGGGGSTNSPKGSFNAIDECSCPQPCSESTYGVTVSTALWPSDVYQPPDCKESSPSWVDAQGCSKWYGENTMLIEVYYERMNYQLLSESEAYGIVNLVSDMGGQLGLWMGISVITVVEFLSLIVLLCLYCLAKKKPEEEEESETDSDDDKSSRSGRSSRSHSDASKSDRSASDRSDNDASGKSDNEAPPAYNG